MARPEEAKAVQAFKEAKTGEEMVRSWGAQSPGREMDSLVDVYRLFIDNRPDIIETWAHRPLQEIMDRGILDRKTRELCFLAILLAWQRHYGVIAHVANAKAAGVTDEEILERVEANKVFLETKREQGFTQLLLVPFGMKLREIADRVQDLILKKHEEGN